jgi:hypothetical protein
LLLNPVQYNENHKPVLDSFLLDNPLVSPGKMYGHPAYYVGGKMFASLFGDGVCLKIPENRVKELLKEGHIVPFEPRGRKMREWVLIVRENSDDYLKDQEIFEESIDFVLSLTQSEKK